MFSILGLGVALFLDSFVISWWELFTYKPNNGGLKYNIEIEDDFTELVAGSIFIIIAIVMLGYKKKYELWYNRKYVSNLIAIKQQGLQTTNFPNFNKNIVGKDFRNYQIVKFDIDEIKFDKNKEYQNSITNQNDVIQNIKECQNTLSCNELAYFGLSRIPLTYRLGVKLSDTQRISVFDYNRDQQKWNQISHYWWINKLQRERKFSIIKSSVNKPSSNDLIIAISTTFSVSKASCLEVIPNYYKYYDLRLSKIGTGKRDRFKTINEINVLTEQFRKLMDEISTDNNIRTVHLFYAGPNSLVFKFGTVFSESMHPNILIYNYNRNDTPCYSWAYDVGKDEILNL